MKIAYVLASDIARHLGSTRKIREQVKVWREMGESVEVFCISPDLEPSILECHRFQRSSNLIGEKTGVNLPLIQAVARFDPDIIYFRYSPATRTFRWLQESYPSVVEINTDDTVEYRTQFISKPDLKSLMNWCWNQISRGGFLRSASGLVCVTRELSEVSAFARLNRRREVIHNSTTIAQPPLKRTDLPSHPLSLFCIGSPGLNWHGTDQLAELAGIAGDAVDIHIVGETGEDRDNLHWYGYLSEEEYLPIMERCHICVGTLGLHRKGLSEGCPLKTREYVKHGFPIVLGYKDTAFLNETPEWVLELPNRAGLFRDCNVVERLLRFAEEYADYVVPREDGERFFSPALLEGKRLGFMREIVANTGKSE